MHLSFNPITCKTQHSVLQSIRDNFSKLHYIMSMALPIHSTTYCVYMPFRSVVTVVHNPSLGLARHDLLAGLLANINRNIEARNSHALALSIQTVHTGGQHHTIGCGPGVEILGRGRLQSDVLVGVRLVRAQVGGRREGAQFTRVARSGEAPCDGDVVYGLDVAGGREGEGESAAGRDGGGGCDALDARRDGGEGSEGGCED